jgi:hypothetical protein
MSEKLRDRLAQVAAENGRGVGEEMRRRLEGSFRSTPSDEPKTGELVRAITFVAQFLQDHCAAWQENLWAFIALKSAIETLLTEYQPAGEAVRPPLKTGATSMFLDFDTPEASGRMLAGLALTLRDR